MYDIQPIELSIVIHVTSSVFLLQLYCAEWQVIILYCCQLGIDTFLLYTYSMYPMYVCVCMYIHSYICYIYVYVCIYSDFFVLIVHC